MADLYISWFEVPMNYAPFVRCFECLGNLLGDGQGFPDRHRSVSQPVGQRRPFDQFQHQGVGAVVFFQSVDGSNVRVVERS